MNELAKGRALLAVPVADIAYLVDLGKSLNVRSVQDTQGQANHLQVLTTRCRGDASGLCPHVEDDGPLQPRDQEVRALVDDALFDTRHPVEDDGARTALDVEDGLAGKYSTDGCWHRHAVRQIKKPRSSCHLERAHNQIMLRALVRWKLRRLERGD